MTLAHPALSMGGKRKGKVKFRNAEEARKARELAAEWERNQAKWASMSTKVIAPKRESLTYSLSAPAGRTTSNHIPSLNTGEGIASTKQTPQYTGTKIIGVTIVHKSCLQPVFNQQEAIDAANMRR